MAFSLYASTGATTTQLNDEAPFRFESIEGLSGAGAIRHEQRSPLQSGATDLGYRLQPRVITLNLIFRATTDAILDTYRSTLMAAFKPLDDISTFLSVQRDDGEIRTLTVHRVGDIAIELAPEYRPGHMHRAILKLRAANPLWKANTVTSGSATFTALTNWWFAGGAISQSNMIGSITYPGYQGGNPGALGTATGDWSVGFVTSKDVSATGTAHYVFSDGAGGSASFRRGNLSGTQFAFYDAGAFFDWPSTTDYNYHVVESRSGTQFWRYWNGTSLVGYGTATVDVSLRYGANFFWRGLRADSDDNYGWANEVRKGVILGTVTVAQLNALAPYMLNTLQGSVTLVNDGDTNAYPVISLHGPMADPVIVNTTTGGTIDLTGGTLVLGERWTIDLRTGDKRIYNQVGDNMLGSVTTTPIGMANFYLAPSPIASGGTNVLVMTPGSVGASAYFAAEIQNQYVSF